MPAELPVVHTEAKVVSSAALPRSVVIVVDQDDLVGPDLRWAIRAAKLEEAGITFLIRVTDKQVDGRAEIDLTSTEELTGYRSQITQRLFEALNEYIGQDLWRGSGQQDNPDNPKADTDEKDNRLPISLRLLVSNKVVEEIKQLSNDNRVKLVLFVSRNYPDNNAEGTRILHQALRSVSCSAGVVVPGTRQADGDVMVAAGRGSHGRAAIDLAASLATGADTGLETIYVEPDIGPDAEAVGYRILERYLKGTREEKLPPEVSRRVVVQDDPARGIIEAGKKESIECMVVGATRLIALGQDRAMTIPTRVLRSKPDATLIVLRKAIPLPSRLGRWVDSRVERHVPQLERDGRISLIDRIQSQSRWNFDFVALMGLSTIIAALGLMDNSAAVIIGAMLVAPLMTPLLGIGLGIAQGNPQLARVTIKAGSFGFLTAFCIALLIGLVSREFYQATGEMSSRDWPQVLDLVIAFVSGLAAAYASGRPGLVAALPGVAIAAALVPPIATSGLAVSIGDWDLALGSLLLFGVNVIAIVIAAAVCFRATGIREFGKVRSQTGMLRVSMIVLSVVMIFALTFTPPLLAAPYDLVEAVEVALGEDFRLRDIHLRTESDGVKVQMDVGGTELPDKKLKKSLKEIASKHLGKDVAVRLTFRYEAVLK